MRKTEVFAMGSPYREELKISGYTFGYGEKSVCIVGSIFIGDFDKCCGDRRCCLSLCYYISFCLNFSCNCSTFDYAHSLKFFVTKSIIKIGQKSKKTFCPIF